MGPGVARTSAGCYALLPVLFSFQVVATDFWVIIYILVYYIYIRVILLFKLLVIQSANMDREELTYRRPAIYLAYESHKNSLTFTVRLTSNLSYKLIGNSQINRDLDPIIISGLEFVDRPKKSKSLP